jgi:hypothetical protein
MEESCPLTSASSVESSVDFGECNHWPGIADEDHVVVAS